MNQRFREIDGIMLLLLFLNIQLKKVISDKSIYISFFPFMPDKGVIKWSKIKNIEIVKYNGIKEFRGIGL